MNENLSYGKKNRIEKLKNSKGFFFFLALDHQLSNGRFKELDNISEWGLFADKLDISGIVLNKGGFSNLPTLTKVPLILQTIGSPNVDNTFQKTIIASVKNSIKLDCTAISIQINFESDNFLTQLDNCIKIIQKAEEYDFPVLCMINSSNEIDLVKFKNYIKYCSELGVDFIKIKLPKEINEKDSDLLNFIENSPNLLLAGGEKDDNFLNSVAKALKIGFKGVCIGRNVFSAEDPKKVVETINNLMI